MKFLSKGSQAAYFIAGYLNTLNTTSIHCVIQYNKWEAEHCTRNYTVFLPSFLFFLSFSFSIFSLKGGRPDFCKQPPKGTPPPIAAHCKMDKVPCLDHNFLSWLTFWSSYIRYILCKSFRRPG